jgi:hypothetical protein
LTERLFRRNIKYLEATPQDIKPLIPSLPFIKNKQSWGYVFKFGFLEIDQVSFEIIAKAMLKSTKIKEIIGEN